MSEKAKKIILYVTGVVMIFAIFMFFMDVVKWKPEIINPETYVPSFFDAMFGKGGNIYFTFAVAPGMLILFILQILISVGLLVIYGLNCLKKINTKTFFLGAAIGGLLAIVCGSLSFASPNLINEIIVLEQKVSIAGYTSLNVGGIIYGVVMMVSGIVSLIPYVATYCLKK